ncbi:MAG: DMT family transporter [Chloroflexota bacterium]
MTSTVRASFYVLLAATCAAFSWIFAETLLQFYGVPLIWAIILSNVAGGISLIAFSIRSSQPSVWTLSRKQWRNLIIVSICLYVASTLGSYYSVLLIGSGKSTLLGLLQSPVVVIFAIVFLSERLQSKHWIAGGFILLGAFLINFNPNAFTLEIGIGESARIATTIFVAVGIILMKPIVAQVNAIQATGVSILISVIFLLMALPLFDVELQLNVPIFVLLTIVGILRGLSWLLYYIALPVIGVSRGIILFGSNAFFTVLLQVAVVAMLPFLGLKLPSNLLMALLGGVFMLGGIALMNRS